MSLNNPLISTTCGTSSSGVIYPSGGIKSCGEDAKTEYAQEYRKTFSKPILEHKIEEYKAGKFSKHYIQIYLDFCHMEGVVDNLKYLEYKEELDKE